MELKKISLCETVPHIRFWYPDAGPRNLMFPVSVAYDCRIFYITDGNGFFYINEKEYPVCVGTLIIMPHGSRYIVDAVANFLMFNFDFTSDGVGIPPFSPVEPKDFDPKKLVSPVHFTDTDVFESIIYIKNAQRFYPALLDIYRELCSSRFGASRHADLLFGAFLIDIARVVSFSDPDNENKAEHIVHYIQDNLSGDLSDKALGDALHYHPNHIRKMITEYTGVSTHRYILECRLSKALEMLVETDLPLKNVCENSGFNDFSHFTKAFKKKYGKNPSEYR